MKRKTEKLFGLFLISAADFSMGLFSAILVSWLFHKHLTIVAVLFGMFFSVLPDLDFIVEIEVISILLSRLLGVPRDRLRHRLSWMHYPLVMLAPCLLFFYFSVFWGLLAFLPLLGHFFHDFEEGGVGIALLFPFKKKKYLLRNWKKIDEPTEEEKHYHLTVNEFVWIKDVYLKFAPRPIIGFISFMAAAIWAAIIIL